MSGEGRVPVEVLKVSATSKPVAVAGAIAGVIRSKGRVEVQAIGAGTIHQAVKAIAIPRGLVAPGGGLVVLGVSALSRGRAHGAGFRDGVVSSLGGLLDVARRQELAGNAL